MIKVLFISAWYPHRYDAMAGLFVQKHAEAVSLYANVKVLYVHADNKINDFEIITTQHNNVEEIIVYYPTSNLWKLGKIIHYFRAYKKGFDKLKKKGWQADILHTNVLTRTPFIGYIYKKTSKTPYVITEHWTRLLKARNQFNGFFRKLLAKMVVKNAAYILPVSTELLEGLKFNHLLLTKYKIVENVVDKCFYETYPIETKKKKQLLNVTCFLEEAKNLFGLLRSVKELSLQRTDFEVILVGTGIDYEKTYNYFKTLNIPDDVVHFIGEKTSKEVAFLMQNTDFVVQFSNYESAGVVVEEALVSGKPIISTKVGIAPDVINESNGLLVEVNNEKQLIESINYLLDNIDKYDNKQIRKNASEAFSYENIGKKYVDIYTQILQK